MDTLDRIEAFAPSSDDWNELGDLVQSLVTPTTASVPALLRVFERFPRHDGHGVFWSILHTIESIEGYAPILVEHVMRTPTEMGVTMVQRLVNAGITHVGVHELAPLVVMLSARAPIIDYTLEPITQPTEHAARAVTPLLDELAAFSPPESWDVDWSPLRALVDSLVATHDIAIVTPLLRTLDRFHIRDGFSPFWPIVNGLEQLPGFASALVASMQATPTRNGLTLLLRLLARGTSHVDGVDVAALAATHLAAS